ncbi:MAG: hypothetical protein ACRD1T_19220, partial [Acidimicrobiia bacterium]
FAVLNTNDFKQGFERIVRDNSSYYVLGYYPTNSRRDGRFRKIEVRVTNPRLQVRARKGYVAPTGRAAPTTSTEAKEGTSPILRDVLHSPLPQGGLTLTVFAAPFKGSAPNSLVTVAVLIDGKDLSFKEKEGRFENTIELSMMALDQQGKMRGGERHTVKMELKPETRARVNGAGFRLMSHLEIPHGRYQLRIAAREALGGRVGSVYYDLEVPDFTKAPLVMSGLAITSAAANLVPTADPKAELNQLPITPTTEREFQVGDTLTVFGEVYDNIGLPTSAIVEVTTQLRADDGRIVFQSRDERSTSELPGGRGGYVHTTTIPLKEASPGLYVLRLEARHRAKGLTVAREVQLKVRA